MKNFKKVIFALMVVFLVVGFIGCKTESDPPKAPVDSGEEGGEVTSEKWTVLDPDGIIFTTFESLEEVQEYVEENELELGVDYTMDEETHTITLLGDGSEEVYYYMHDGEPYGGKNTLEDFYYEVELYDLVEGTDYTIDHENKYINFTDSGCAKLEG